MILTNHTYIHTHSFIYWKKMSTDKNHDNELTAEQLAHIERNRQKALLRQQKKQRDLTTDEVYRLERYNELNVQSSQDFGGGFFVDHHDQYLFSTELNDDDDVRNKPNTLKFFFKTKKKLFIVNMIMNGYHFS